MRSPHIEVRNLCKEYSGRKALDNINFSVDYGEFFALVGPNGAGKTTLLRILDLLEEPTSGEVWLEGAKVDYSSGNIHLLRRKIGFVPQKPILFNTTVFNNVAYGLRIRGLSSADIRRMVKEILEMVGMSSLENRNALTLSGGEAQRVSLAQALVTEPTLLLLDEPTANLDPKSASIIEEALSHINRERGTTIIMATHEPLQVERLADRVAILSEGRIVGIGGFSEVLGRGADDISIYMGAENVFIGSSTVTEDGISIIDIGNGLRIEAAFKRSGNVRIYVPPESIIVLAERPLTSARNIFRGRITQMLDYGHIIRLRVKVINGKNFITQITRKSLEEMRLNIGSEVFIAFKASSVKLI